MRVHAWSGTVERDDGGPHGMAMSPGIDAQTRARPEARRMGTRWQRSVAEPACIR